MSYPKMQFKYNFFLKIKAIQEITYSASLASLCD